MGTFKNKCDFFLGVSNIQAPGGKNALRLQALCTMNEKAPESIWNVVVIRKIQNVTNFCGFHLQKNYVYGTRVPLEARKGGNKNSKNFQCLSAPSREINFTSKIKDVGRHY